MVDDGASFLFMCKRYGGENAVQNIVCSTTNIVANKEITKLMMCEYWLALQCSSINTAWPRRYL